MVGIESGLKCVQGKCNVNSISLKRGLAPFIRQAQEIKRYGAAAVVMATDEDGQADTADRKVEICERAYKILRRMLVSLQRISYLILIFLLLPQGSKSTTIMQLISLRLRNQSQKVAPVLKFLGVSAMFLSRLEAITWSERPCTRFLVPCYPRGAWHGYPQCRNDNGL